MGRFTMVVLCVLIVGLVSGCNWGYIVPPALTFCEKNGGTWERRVEANGSENGICTFPDGSECEQWAFYRGECKPGQVRVTPGASTPQAGLPNPASVYCQQNAGRLQLVPDAAGNVLGLCVFPDGSECEEWAYFRGECKQGTAIGGATPESAASLTMAALQNARYHSPDWGDYQLVDGLYHRPGALPGESSDIYVTQLLEPVAFGDLNGDGVPDAVAFLSTQNGGTGNFREMAAMIDQGGTPENVSTVSLGDRVVIEAAQIEAGVITLNMRVQGPNDGMCCPSQSVTWRYRLEGGSLVKLP